MYFLYNWLSRHVATKPEMGEHGLSAANELAPCVIWFTGLPSAGKTTLALMLKHRFAEHGITVEHLDGDTVRSILPGIGFSRDERNNHIRRMGFMASRLEAHGVTVIASFVSPYRESRDFVRGLCRNFIEIYLSTELEECLQRDVKGLYAEARSGHRSAMTGVDDPYEPPLNPELVLNTATLAKDNCITKIEHLLVSRGLLIKQSVPGNGLTTTAELRLSNGSPIAS